MTDTVVYTEDLLKPITKRARVVHKNYRHEGLGFLLCSGKLAANYKAPLRARSTLQWRYVTCRRCVKKRKR